MRIRRGLWSTAGIGLLAACTLVGVPPAGTAPDAPERASGDGPALEEPLGEGRPTERPPTEESAAERASATEPSDERPFADAPPTEAATDGTSVEEGAAEVRALWVVRTSLTHPDSVRAMVRRAERAGFNTLLLQVRGRGDALYRSSVEPPSELLRDAPPGFDPLSVALDEARRRGIDVHAWINVHLVAGVGRLPRDPSHLVHARPQLLAVPRALAADLAGMDPGDPAYVAALLGHAREHSGQIEGLFTSPSSALARRHVEAVVRDLLARYDVDGVHLDYLRYPSPDFDYSSRALEAFRSWARFRIEPERARELDRRRVGDAFAWADGLPDLLDEFRRQEVHALVRTVRRVAGDVRPGALVTAAVRADPVDARQYRFQDWGVWLDRGWVDAVAPMAYTDDPDLFRGWVGSAVERSGGRRIWAGIGVYKTTLAGTLEQIRLSRSLGAGGISLFSYDWAVSEARSDRPGVPWLDRVGQEAFSDPRPVE